MEVNTEGNITTVTLTYEEWEKNPFPQVRPLLLDHTTRYVVKGIPADKKHLFDGIGNVICLN